MTKKDYKIVKSYSTKKLYKFMALKLHSNSKDSQITVEYNLFSNFSIVYFAIYWALNKQGDFKFWPGKGELILIIACHFT